MYYMVRPTRNRRRRNRKYGRGKPYVKNNKIYFGGEVYKGGAIPLFSIVYLVTLVRDSSGSKIKSGEKIITS